MLLSVTYKQDENPTETNYTNYVGRIQMGLLANNIVDIYIYICSRGVGCTGWILLLL